MSASVLIMHEDGVLRYGRAAILDTLLPQLAGINLPDFVANDVDPTDELIEALGRAWDFGSKG
ncbi:hypothetical protein [Thalassospira sp.]|uniref:hypothetical protein n=1 Tax=Thalassospira sp. TaxID=1912094 RepID=UPI002732E851|nr:hypothetical protein [Thalassospira sp.]MDP2699551.1 hypothetical protein [Thalassospira sp.]